jgi:hypothetical protein
MRHKRIIRSIAGALAVLVGLAFGYYYLILDWNGRPTCHKGIMLSFLTVMHESGENITNDPKPFPNVKGLSRDSLETIRESMAGHMDWATNYNYVPGLREDDPADLVLLYYNRPTRWNWHGAPPTIFREKAWIVIPVDFGGGSSFRPHAGQLGECSERVSLVEFRNRLTRTMDFVRTNKRPNWQAVVAEHSKFLESIEHVER